MNFLSKTIEYGLYLLVFLLPVQTRWIIKAGYTEYAAYSLYGTDILLILVLLLFIIYKFLIFNFQFSNKSQFSIFNFQTYLIFGLLLASGISALFALDKLLALYKFGWLVLGAGLFWLVIKADYSRTKLVWSLLVGLALQAVLAIGQFLTQATFANKWLGLAFHNGADLGTSVIETIGAGGLGERWLRTYGGTDHPNVLGGIVAIGVLLLIGEMMINIQYPISNIQINSKFKIQNSKVILWIFMVAFTAALFFSFSRAAWLALALALAAMLAGAVIRRDWLAQQNILQAVLVSGIVFFVLFFQYPNLVMTRFYPVKFLRNDEVLFNGVNAGERLEIKSSKERVESLKNSWPIIKNNWASGVGLGNYVLALERELPKQNSYFYQPAHNAFLLVWAETGIFGLILFILLLLSLLMTKSQFPPPSQCEAGQAMTNKIPNKKPQVINKFINLILGFGHWDLGFRENESAPSKIINLSVLTSLIVLLALDHWLWSLHFGVLFFWLVVGLAGSVSARRD